MKYDKASLTFREQLDLLKSRGLSINDDEQALLWLSRVSYYRLSAYMLPFKDQGNNRFVAGTTFDDISDLYVFDRKLRLLCMDAIERIEIALRTSVTYQLAHKHGPFGYADPKVFDPHFKHDLLMSDLNTEEARAKETFVDHFRGKYNSETHLPVWMATELLSFGRVSQIFKALAPTEKKAISKDFGLPTPEFLASWLHTLSYVRNICAHHKRLWNRRLAIRPRIPSRYRYFPLQDIDNDRLYAGLVITRSLLKTTAPQSRWHLRLGRLFDEHSAVSREAMGIPNNWQSLQFWSGD